MTEESNSLAISTVNYGPTSFWDYVTAIQPKQMFVNSGASFMEINRLRCDGNGMLLKDDDAIIKRLRSLNTGARHPEEHNAPSLGLLGKLENFFNHLIPDHPFCPSLCRKIERKYLLWYGLTIDENNNPRNAGRAYQQLTLNWSTPGRSTTRASWENGDYGFDN